MKRKTVGLILGYGHMGRLHQVRLDALGVETLVFDGERECRRALDVAGGGFHPDGDVFSLIAVPASFHFEYVKLSLEAGLDVFVEKPLATSLSQARELARLARRQKSLLFVGHSEIFNPGFLHFKESLAGALEKSRLESLSFTRHNAASARGLDVSDIWDIGVHDFALFHDLMRAFPDILWERIPVSFSESRCALKPERFIRAELLSADGGGRSLFADLDFKKRPDSACEEPLMRELREFLGMMDLPETQKLQQMERWLETALFAVRAAESYPEIPKRPK